MPHPTRIITLKRRSADRRSHPLQPAFTLIELLTCIAIIGILTSFAIIGIKQAISSANASKCLGNLRQIGVSIQLYCTDNSGRMPPSVGLNEKNAVITYPDLLMPYITGDDASYDEDERQNYFSCPEADADSFAISDYSVNERWTLNDTTGVFARQAWGVEVPSVRMTDIRNPQEVYALSDSFQQGDIRNGAWMSGKQIYQGTVFSAGTTPSAGPAPRHFDNNHFGSGQFNVLFCDGHTESIRWDDPRLQDSAFRQRMCTP